MTDIVDKVTRRIAISQGYNATEIEAGIEYFKRKNRLNNPLGNFDNAKRFYANERTDSVEKVRSPSRAYPYSEMKAARSAAHCAEVHNVKPIAVKRIEKSLALENSLPRQLSQHERIAAGAKIKKILKPLER